MGATANAVYMPAIQATDKPSKAGQFLGGSVPYGYKVQERHLIIDEWYVCEQTVLYVLTHGRMELIAAAVVAEYDNEFNSEKIAELERRISKLGRDIDKYTEMLLEIPKAARKNIYAKIEMADMQKTDLEIDVSKLKTAILTQKRRIRTPRMEFVF